MKSLFRNSGIAVGTLAFLALGAVCGFGCAPAISVAPESLDFAGGETAKTFEIWNGAENGSTLHFDVVADEDWIEVAPAEGTSTGSNDKVSITVSVLPEAFAKTAYTGSVRVSAAGADGTTLSITAHDGTEGEGPAEGAVDGEALPEGEPGPFQITFATSNAEGEGNTLWRVEARDGAEPENFSALLDAIVPLTGPDFGPLSVSWTGEWYVFNSERFDADAQGWGATVLVSHDLAAYEVVRTPEGLLHVDEAVLTSDGDRLVFTAQDGPNALDVWLTERDGNAWTTPVALTTASPFEYNEGPRLSFDDARVCFDCGDSPFADGATGICEVALDGTGFREVLGPDDGPDPEETGALHAPAYTPDGAIVFESDWGGSERVWRLPAGGGSPELLRPSQTNDNSPIVLPDGAIASLWLNRPGSDGTHELKVMSPSGDTWYMLVSSELTPETADVFDIGLGAGRLLLEER